MYARILVTEIERKESRCVLDQLRKSGRENSWEGQAGILSAVTDFRARSKSKRPKGEK